MANSETLVVDCKLWQSCVERWRVEGNDLLDNKGLPFIWIQAEEFHAGILYKQDVPQVFFGFDSPK